EDMDALCFSYTPIDELRVHNANMLGAGLLARVGALTHEEKLIDAAHRATRYLLRYQHDDGGWWYAEAEYQHWIDSFHTGFNLVALQHVLRDGGMVEAAEALERGHLYFLRHFYEPDGAPRYFHDRRDPIDVHCPAQGFVTMTRLWDVTEAPELLERSARWFLDHMRAPEGYFYYRLRRHGPNRIPYLRWGQAWAYFGLAHLEEFLSGADSYRKGEAEPAPRAPDGPGDTR
ncbi:MAG: pectate lyase, partial [Planctomycetota bacterium]|nr:pectate lyase [Planctomycetota bacterium]